MLEKDSLYVSKSDLQMSAAFRRKGAQYSCSLLQIIHANTMVASQQIYYVIFFSKNAKINWWAEQICCMIFSNMQKNVQPTAIWFCACGCQMFTRFAFKKRLLYIFPSALSIFLHSKMDQAGCIRPTLLKFINFEVAFWLFLF